MTAAYEHTQKGHWLFIWILLTGAFIVAAGHYFMLERAPLRNSAETTLYCITVASGLISGLFMIWATMMMSSLNVRIENGFIRIRFGAGTWRKKFALAEVASAKPVKSSFWHGWGIHYTGSAWLYNVAGLDAVEIILQNGKRRRIGTDEPQLLAAAINTSLPGE